VRINLPGKALPGAEKTTLDDRAVGGFNRVADFPVAASAQTSRVSRKSQGANLGFFFFKMALDSPF
jgi:hypothetical protein